MFRLGNTPPPNEENRYNSISYFESGHPNSPCHPCESGDLVGLLTTLVPYGTACWRRLWLPVKRGMTEHGRFTTFLSSLGKQSATHAPKKGNCPVDNLIWGAMRHNESKWKTQDELMSELKSILPLKNKGSQRGFAQNPSCTFPYVLREGQIGRSTPTCHPWTSVSEIRGSTGRGFNVPHSTRFAQCGRSMVETLGTLAIMGILGVAGVAAYNNAMNSHRANEVVHSVSKMAVSAAGQFLMRDSFSLNEFNNKTDNGYTASELNYGKEPIFGIRVEGLPKEICQKIVAMHWTKPKEIAINGGLSTACSDNATMDFIFSKNLEADDYEVERCTADADCFSGCDKCVNGVCQESCAEGKVCARGGGSYRKSTRYTCCAEEKIIGNRCCADIKYDKETGKKLCLTDSIETIYCPENTFLDYDRKCHECDDSNSYTMYGVGSYCYTCPNRKLSGWMCMPGPNCPDADQIEIDGECYCPENKPIIDTKGHCHACSEPQNGWAGWWINPILSVVKMDKDVCFSVGKCGNFVCRGSYIDIKCNDGEIGANYAARNFQLKDGTNATGCHDCSDVDITTIKFESQCKICGGKWTGENWYTGACSKT